MDEHPLARYLADSYADRHLSRTERKALSAVLADLDDAERAAVRRLAFDLFRNQATDADRTASLEWLEEVVATLMAHPGPKAASHPESEALFSPWDDCSHRIRQMIAGATQTVDICVFTITDDRISEAILDAHGRGISVRVITDDEKSFDLGSDIDRFRAANLPLRTDRSEFHMHHKFAIFDARRLLTGSYNWTRGAARDNLENIVVTADTGLIARFGQAFDRLWERLA